MDLKKAIEILKEFVEIDRRLRAENEYTNDYDSFCEERCIAIDTALDYIENSIPKEAIHKKMQQVEIDYRNKKKMTTDTTTRIWWEHEHKAQMEVLSELLKEVEND